MTNQSFQSFIHADIFFFISTIALVGISVGICIALYYLIKILRDVKDVSAKVRAESSELVSDFRKARMTLREEGVKLMYVFDMVRNFFIRKNSNKKHGK